MNRRSFLRHSTGIGGGLAATDFLNYLLFNGTSSFTPSLAAAAREQKAESGNPRFLIYWCMEGGWMSYDMFSPVVPTRNDANFGDLPRDPNAWDVFSEHIYRTKELKPEDFKKHGRIFHGPLGEDGKDLFPEMAVLSSMRTGTSHSNERWRLHFGQYKVDTKAHREPDERTVLQAFAEVYGREYLLANLNWHRWLSDGELDLALYPEGAGFYHALGPPWAHATYAQTPKTARHLIERTMAMRHDERNRLVQRFLEQPRHQLLSDKNNAIVRSFVSALDVYDRLIAGDDKVIDPASLFSSSTLREEFNVTPEDEETEFTVVGASLARSKNTPNINVQAMMMYEMMTQGLSCAGWLENRKVRAFDHHQLRRLFADGFPFNQRQLMRESLWTPLSTFVRKLKATEYANTGRPYWNFTTIVVTSEFGRRVNGDVSRVVSNPKLSDEEKRDAILRQDINTHNAVTSCAFLGAGVRGATQFGMAGQQTLEPIPVHIRTGDLDPRYEPSGAFRPGYTEMSPGFVIPNHGHVNATALKLSGIDKGNGRNEAPYLPFILKDQT